MSDIYDSSSTEWESQSDFSDSSIAEWCFQSPGTNTPPPPEASSQGLTPKFDVDTGQLVQYLRKVLVGVFDDRQDMDLKIGPEFKHFRLYRRMRNTPWECRADEFLQFIEAEMEPKNENQKAKDEKQKSEDEKQKAEDETCLVELSLKSLQLQRQQMARMEIYLQRWNTMQTMSKTMQGISKICL